MRKPVAILLLLLYIIASSGVVIEAHYAKGKLRSVQFTFDHSSDRTSTDSKKVCNQRRAVVASDNDTGNNKTGDASSGNPVSETLNAIGVVSQILYSGL